MKTRKAPESGSCEAIEAVFAFGPVRCGIWTDLITDDSDPVYVCEKHASSERDEGDFR